MSDKVLFVDDDPNILEAVKRQLRKHFVIDTAASGEEGVAAVSEKGPYAVVVSDMNMPGMDGIQFLSSIREKAPDTVRIMLTGMAKMDTAIEAVNEGRIFRFLTKPCDAGVIALSLKAGIEQYHLVKAEKELLEMTLSRSVKVLIDILALVNPVAFSRSARLRRYVKHMISEMGLTGAWQYELAAMLSQIGCVTLPPETLQKAYADMQMSNEENEAYKSHPAVGSRLLKKIPRLELVSKMIEKQLEPFSVFVDKWSPDSHDPVDIGAQMLKVSIEFDRLLTKGMPYDKAVEKLLQKTGECNPLLVTTLKDLKPDESQKQAKTMKIQDLDTNMTVAEDVWTKAGILLVPEGEGINYLILERLRNFWSNGSIPDQIRVLV